MINEYKVPFVTIIHFIKSGHQLVKQVLQNGNCSPMIIRQVANFLCRGKLFDENGELIKVKFKCNFYQCS